MSRDSPSRFAMRNAQRAHYCVLLSAKVANSGDVTNRPEWPAWCALASGLVAAACVADPADVVVFAAELERLGRLCMPEPVAALAPLDRSPCGAVVVALRSGTALVCDVDDDALLPMRRRQPQQQHLPHQQQQPLPQQQRSEQQRKRQHLPIVLNHELSRQPEIADIREDQPLSEQRSRLRLQEHRLQSQELQASERLPHPSSSSRQGSHSPQHFENEPDKQRRSEQPPHQKSLPQAPRREKEIRQQSQLHSQTQPQSPKRSLPQQPDPSQCRHDDSTVKIDEHAQNNRMEQCDFMQNQLEQKDGPLPGNAFHHGEQQSKQGELMNTRNESDNAGKQRCTETRSDLDLSLQTKQLSVQHESSVDPNSSKVTDREKRTSTDVEWLQKRRNDEQSENLIDGTPEKLSPSITAANLPREGDEQGCVPRRGYIKESPEISKSMEDLNLPTDSSCRTDSFSVLDGPMSNSQVTPFGQVPQGKPPLARLAAPTPPSVPMFLSVAETDQPVAFAALKDGRVVAWPLVPKEMPFSGEIILPQTVFTANLNTKITALDASPLVLSTSESDGRCGSGNIAIVIVALDSGIADVLHVTVGDFDDESSTHTKLFVQSLAVGSQLHSCSSGGISLNEKSRLLSLSPRAGIFCDYGRILGVSWAGEGRVVFSGEDDGVYVIDVEKGGARCPVGCHNSYSASVATRGDLVASAGWDGRLMLWSLNAATDIVGRHTSLAVETGVELLSVESGRIFWGVEWPLEHIVFASTLESSGRCLLYRIELDSDYLSDDNSDSYGTRDSRMDYTMPA